MPTVQVHLTSGPEEAARIAFLLEAAVEAEGYPVTREETPAYSGIWTVTILFWDREPDDAVAFVRDVLGSDAFGLEARVEVLDDDTNWIAKSLEVLRPVAAGRFLVHGSHDRAAVRGSVIGLEIDAQMAFGTGHHATTWGCLAALDLVMAQRRFRRVLDLGTGTGVLAFAVARQQKVKVVGTDIDPVATAIARTNARINGVAPLVRLITADGLSDRRIAAGGPYDLIIANILARPLMKLARGIRSVVAPGGLIVLSGLRESEGAKVAWAYRQQGFRLVRQRQRDIWLTLVFADPRRVRAGASVAAATLLGPQPD